MNRLLGRVLLGAVLCGALPSTASAQRSSLYLAPVGPSQPLSLEHHSWLFVEMPPVRELQINDLVTIIVNQTQQSKNTGKINQITQANIDLRLRDWVELDHFGIKAAPQTSGDPRARGSLDGQMRTNAELDSSALMRFTITATIVDIRPNGNLVLEAHSKTEENNEICEKSLTGIVRREDVSPRNTVLSEQIAELSIHKRETGRIRDAVKRGWLYRVYDNLKPF